MATIRVDKHKVLQILTNLVRNARQACHEAAGAEKQLTLRVTNGENCVRIAVSDNGVGILPENLPRIFVHGFTTKKDGHGYGLKSAALAAQGDGRQPDRAQRRHGQRRDVHPGTVPHADEVTP